MFARARSDIRELAESNEFYRATKADYIERGELLTLALFDCALQMSHGAFDLVKRLVNLYAVGEMTVSDMHRDILAICLEAGAESGGATWPLKVFRHEFPLLLGGLSQAQVAEAEEYHEQWRRRWMPLPASPLLPSQAAPPVLPAPLALHAPATEWESQISRALSAAERVPSTEWDGQIYDAPLPSSPVPQPEWVRRPWYNHYIWPSPLPKLVALEAGLTTNKRCKHADAVALLARRMQCSPEDFYEMSRDEVCERLFGKRQYSSPAWSTGVRKLLAQPFRPPY
jgi:hypothetical protein